MSSRGTSSSLLKSVSVRLAGSEIVPSTENAPKHLCYSGAERGHLARTLGGDPHTHEAPLWRAALAAAAAALAGAAVWGLIVVVTDYEVGIVAWGIGALTGYAVVAATGGRRGPRLQAIAVAASVVGVLLGKYVSFWWAVREEARDVGRAVGADLAAEYGLFSSGTFELFRDDLGNVFDWLDLLFFGLAIYVAWRIPRPEPVEEKRAATEA